MLTEFSLLFIVLSNYNILPEDNIIYRCYSFPQKKKKISTPTIARVQIKRLILISAKTNRTFVPVSIIFIFYYFF